jgi:hypothetical protein
MIQSIERNYDDKSLLSINGQKRDTPFHSILVTCSVYGNNTINAFPNTLASCCWIENIVVDVILRNRDRFVLCWPHLKSHYMRTLADQNAEFSRISEYQLLGIFTICKRMLSRESCVASLLESLSKIFNIQQLDHKSGDSLKKYCELGDAMKHLLDHVSDLQVYRFRNYFLY